MSCFLFNFPFTERSHARVLHQKRKPKKEALRLKTPPRSLIFNSFFTSIGLPIRMAQRAQHPCDPVPARLAFTNPAPLRMPSSNSSHLSPQHGKLQNTCCRLNRHDLQVYLVTDRATAGKRGVANVVREAVKGGANIVQLRDKDIDRKKSIELGLELREITRQAGVLFVVNDDIELAGVLKADGVHVGQGDASVSEVRRVLGDNTIVGVSARDVEQAQRAITDGADYLGVGDVFGTKTKKNAVAIGIEGLRKIVEVVDGKIPVVGIGGIGVENVEECWRVGVDGVAVVSAIMGSERPEEVVKKLFKVLES